MNDCTLYRVGEVSCIRPGLIEIEDLTGARAWACPGHAIKALWAVEGARIVRDLRARRTVIDQ